MEKLKELKNILRNITTPIYLAGHVNPDHDSIGSCLAMGRLLEKMGKEVYVLLESNNQDLLEVHDNSHLVINNVDNITTPYTLVALDLNETSRLGVYESLYSKANFTINIDHHQGNFTNADFVLSDSSVSSTCEIIYNLICKFGREYIDQSIASTLYAGILTDTSGFSRRISSTTMQISQWLINKGINYENIIRNTISKRSLYELQALAYLVGQIKLEDNLHYLVIDKSLPQLSELTHLQITKSISEELRKIDSIDTFVIFILESDHIVGKVMSNLTKNANIIAKLFCGGGHKGEAGFTVQHTDYTMLVNEIKQYMKGN